MDAGFWDYVSGFYTLKALLAVENFDIQITHPRFYLSSNAQ